jgi:hypothetical protein
MVSIVLRHADADLLLLVKNKNYLNLVCSFSLKILRYLFFSVVSDSLYLGNGFLDEEQAKTFVSELVAVMI